jgi:hypothetical protein
VTTPAISLEKSSRCPVSAPERRLLHRIFTITARKHHNQHIQSVV